jgi:uncharacterized DUF497 family protein
MIVFYSNHATRRLSERGLEVKNIEETLQNPDKLITENGQKKAVKKFGSVALIVIYKEIDDGLFVITAFNTSKVNKYL